MANVQSELNKLKNAHITESCLEAIKSCDEANGCCSESGVTITEACVEYLSKHAVQTRCLSHGFGCK